ncbi:hypothetical protein N0V93_001326 [Gnomoniopsis smithogilvyi]|uniref:Heavy metal tolerance protein n=1 Tax=Gnomoniopsis smithogilvyi TaxID=1191159 RepID=A0A9W8Z1G5_9PEZI|nr:hypothetical protein N0V93_001326 [Gnomoniopsis smithogilvyi]
MAVSLHLLLVSLRYAYPTLLFVYFLASLAVAACTFQKPSAIVKHPRRRLIKSILLATAITYAAQYVVALTHWNTAPRDTTVSLLACAMVYALEFLILHDTKKPVWRTYIGSLAIGFVVEPLLAVLSLLSHAYHSPKYTQALNILFLATRMLCLALGMIVYFGWKSCGTLRDGSHSEQQALLRKRANGDSEATLVSAYGSTDDEPEEATKSSTRDPESEWERSHRQAEEQVDKRLQESGNWLVYAKGFKLFLPYVWPFHDRRLQVRAALVGVCLLVNNALNVLIPNQLGVVTKALSGSASEQASQNPWIQVLIFAGLKLSASEAGVSLIRSILWLPVDQYSEGAIVEAAHTHILNLDAHFHDTKTLSDMLLAVQNSDSISGMLNTICFELIPNIIDVGIAFIYLTAKFGPWEGLITIGTSTLFIYLATSTIARSRAARQACNKAYYDEWYIMNSGFTGWSTVASFNQTSYECNRFSAAVRERLAKSKAYSVDLYWAQAVQYLVLLAGLVAGLFLAVWQVTREHSIDASDFVVLLTYWSQLVSPLTFFAGLGKSVNRSLVDAERILEIMETKPHVVNEPNAPPLHFKSGQVEFQSVRFSYDDKKEILKNISLSVKPGQTIAFVGKTGAGKSTILKLLDRFYDVTEGFIRIDGQDIRNVDVHSLRAHIGVVPQSPVLFNDSIMDNVRYARLDATDEEVYDACKAAAIHDQILGFSEGYNTRVGERGMKLSGGELQRVAIARAILRKPKMVLLDEATSAIDTETESKIQAALHRLCKNRTTFIVAHRLSTVMNADRIIVVDDGAILEQGTHEKLISAGGKYAELWSKQTFIKPKTDSQRSDDQGSHTPRRSDAARTTSTGDQAEDSAENDHIEAAQVKTPSGHKREV